MEKLSFEALHIVDNLKDNLFLNNAILSLTQH